jgi:serine/threonine-protein kinase HipA
MPANEHLTMQIAAQIYGIETASNALIFFQDGAPAYLTKRFDIADDNTKIAQEDFAVLAGKTPQTAGEDYKYSGCYLDLFVLMQQYVAAYAVEASKLWTQLLFNYLFCNGDAHLKNFSLLQTPQGDYRLSPAYDLLNSRIHVEDADFALSGKLLPPQLAVGKIRQQFLTLAEEAQIATKLADKILQKMSIESAELQKLIQHSYLSERIKRNYLQAYQTRLKSLNK